MKTLIAASLAGFALIAAPAAAQDEAEALTDDVQTAIVYGDDAAPPCPEGLICVVARLPENDRYRIPENLRFSEDPENTAWAQRVEKLELIGDFGIMSCSTAGAGGFTGCTQQLLEQAYGEKRTGANVRFSELIAAARADRLSQIDEQAAEEQARVEQIERQYMERLERERAAEVPGEGEEELPQPDEN
ncbi:hypothetical protein [Erythrobacter sp. HKB08]|uniref:hypothetical protein n=1 Tax=Erythrobacter sp. HKB08 TaxID=2502843 RepID=UPI001008CD6F|nr:hypothetical protein [Erythrobacter sp. HKB08]